MDPRSKLGSRCSSLFASSCNSASVRILASSTKSADSDRHDLSRLVCAPDGEALLQTLQDADDSAVLQLIIGLHGRAGETLATYLHRLLGGAGADRIPERMREQVHRLRQSAILHAEAEATDNG